MGSSSLLFPLQGQICFQAGASGVHLGAMAMAVLVSNFSGLNLFSWVMALTFIQRQEELYSICSKLQNNRMGSSVQLCFFYRLFGLPWVSFSTSVTRSGRYIFYQLINFWLLSEVKYSHTRNEHIFIVRNCWQMQSYACLFKAIYSALKSTWQLKAPISFLKAKYAQTKHVLYKHTQQLATPISCILKAK